MVNSRFVTLLRVHTFSILPQQTNCCFLFGIEAKNFVADTFEVLLKKSNKFPHSDAIRA